MNASNGRNMSPATVALAAAIGIAISMVLPWASAVRSASFFDLLSQSQTSSWAALDWLYVGMIILGTGVALFAAGSVLLIRPLSRSVGMVTAVAFAVALGGFVLFFVRWDQFVNAYGAGASLGIGFFAGIALTVVGLVASIADVQSMPRPWMVSPPAGQWSAPAVASQTTPAPYQVPAGTGGQGPVPRPPLAPTGVWGAAGAVGRIAYVESGRPSSLAVNAGDQVMVGRDADARIRLTDPKVSRRHVMVAWMGNGWSVRDLGATNPTRLLGSSGSAQPIVGEVRIAFGQLLIGDVLVTLFPAGA